MAIATKWDMLVPQDANVVHNLVRNPGFEYNDAFFAGAHQYWYYYNAGGTRQTPSPVQSSGWSALGTRSLSLALDGVTNKYIAYSPRETAFEEWTATLSPTIATAAAPTGVVYTSGNWAACVFLLTPYGVSLATMNDDDPVVSGNNLLPRSGFRQIDLLKGRSKPFYSAVANFGGTVAARQVTFTMPATGTHDYPNGTLGYAVFISTPTLSASGRRIWRLLTVKGGIPDGTAVVEQIPSDTDTSGTDVGGYYGYGSTTFLTASAPASVGNYYVYDASGNEVSGTFVSLDASQPALGVSPTSVAGTTYGHHVYLSWYVDTNYTAGTSPFIACAYDYQVSLYDRTYGTTYTLTNYDTGTSRLGAVPANRNLDRREGRTKFTVTPPNNATNTDAGRDLELRIEIISPTGVYTNNSAVLYIDNVQIVDITYRGDDDYNWDDIEFTYVDGDVAGAEWHDFAPSYRSSSGTTISGINSTWYWLGDTYAGWNATFGMASRDRLISEASVITNTYGGTSRIGYAQSALKTQTASAGTYVPLDAEHMGASISYTSTGMGMPEIVTSSQSYGAIDGGVVQRQVSNMRTIQLAFEINGSSTIDLHNKRRRIINALKFDQLAQQSTRIIRYRGSNYPVIFNTTYTAGLEFTGWQGISFTENANVQFLCADPYAYAELAITKRLVNPPNIQDTRFLMAYKKGDNQPWVYTGMKDYQAQTYGAGTISAPNPTASQGAATVTATITNASTLTLTLNSVTFTLSVAFLTGTATDIGRTLYNTSTGLIYGVIANFINTTSATLATAATASVSTTAWGLSTKTITTSVGLSVANDTGKYIATNAGAFFGKIASISGTSVTLANFYFGLTNTTAVTPYNLFGTNTYGSVSTYTGVNSAFTSADVGETLISTGNVTLGTITAVLSTTSINVDLAILKDGTISIAFNSTAVTGNGTTFTSADVGKLVVGTDGYCHGIISAYTSSTSVTLARVSAVTVVSATFYLITNTAIASTTYTIKTPELNWSGGYKKYHIGIIESPNTSTAAVIVGGFDNGSPAMGYGVSKYHAVFMMDGKQNTSAGNYANSAPRTGTISIATGAAFPYTVTGVGTDFTPSDIGNALYTSADVYIGTVGKWNSSTSVNLITSAAVTIAGGTYRTKSTAVTPNPDYSSVINIFNKNATYAGGSYRTIIPIGPITAIYQESPFSILIAGTFQGYGVSGTGNSDIRIIRVKGWSKRRATTNPWGAANALGAGDEDIEVIVRDVDTGWGTPVINCITVDSNGSIYAAGAAFNTSYVWYIGRPTDGSYATIYKPLGTYTSEQVIAIAIDNVFPTPNVFIAVESAPYLVIYPYYNVKDSTGVWKDPPSQSNALGTFQQAPDDLIFGFLKTQAGDIIAYGAFTQWGGIYGPFVNGIARMVYKITVNTQDYTYVDATPAVPAAGSFTQPGVSAGEYVTAMADFSYSPTTGSYSGTGERLLFGGTFSQFGDGRYSLGLGYLEGSGNASSVRRMAVSDLGLSPPVSSTDYPYINAITATSRFRYYYANNQVNSTDNLVGPSAALLITRSSNITAYANNARYFQSGQGGYATTATYGVPQSMVIPLEVRGTANAYPILTFTLFWRTTIYEVVNTETGARIRFDEVYGLRGVSAFSGATEQITMDFRPGYRTITSNLRGNLMQFVSADSDFANFYLVAPYTTNSTMDTTRTNTIVFRYSVYHDTVGSTSPTVPRITVTYTPKFWSFDVTPLFTDAPDTNLL